MTEYNTKDNNIYKTGELQVYKYNIFIYVYFGIVETKNECKIIHFMSVSLWKIKVACL